MKTRWWAIRSARSLLLALLVLSLLAVTGCAQPVSPTPAAQIAAPEEKQEIILRNWEGDISQDILDAFESQSGIHVVYLPYETQEDAVAQIRAGEVYDVVVLENQLIPALIKENLLASIDYTIVPNFRNISPNFRDLVYDPQNAHSIPYSWGTTGLAVRTDLVEKPVTGWSDLWNPNYAGKLIGWPLERYMIGIALQFLGHSINSEDPAELEAALEQLLILKPRIRLLEWESAVSAPYLVSGEAVLAIGQADDVIEGRQQNPHIVYIMPQEGGILWGDNFTIPANSPHKKAAEKLINFLLSAEISAQIVNQTYYWLPNDAALPLINPEIRDNPAIFPPPEMLENAEILLPLNPEGQALHDQIWQRFLNTQP